MLVKNKINKTVALVLLDAEMLFSVTVRLENFVYKLIPNWNIFKSK